MSNFREMAEILTIFGRLTKYQTLRCEQIIHHFEVCDLEIPNMELFYLNSARNILLSIKSQNLNISRKKYM